MYLKAPHITYELSSLGGLPDVWAVCHRGVVQLGLGLLPVCKLQENRKEWINHTTTMALCDQVNIVYLTRTTIRVWLQHVQC